MKFHCLEDLDDAEGTVLLHDINNDGNLILHPTPNPNDPNDPLRWPKWQKYVCFFSVCSFAFLTNYAIGGMSPAFYPLSIEFDKTVTQTSGLLIWPILTLGVFNFLWVPLALYIGKRPVFVFSTLLLSMAFLWGALAKSFESLLWSTIVAAFAGSASEALAASIVNDVFFLHERANLMGWYMNAIAGGNTIGPLICGFVISGTSWRVHKWHSFGLVVVNFLLVLFFVPETRYDRSTINVDVFTSFDDDPASRNDYPLSPRSKTFPRIAHDPEKDTHVPSTNALECSRQAHQTPKKSYTQTLSLWPGLAKDTNLFKLFFRLFPVLAYPAVIFSFLGFAVSLAWVVAIGILNSFILQAPPYSWSPSINGLINIPALLGNLLGAFIGGWLVDRYSDWRSRTNGGIFQPETRLHFLIVPALIVPAGCLAFGYGVAATLHWTSLFFGYGMVNVGLTAVPTMTMTYVSDSYLPVNADALTLVVGMKNVVAFGVLYGVVPWVDSVGYVKAFGTQAGIFVAIMMLGVPLVIWGQQIRDVTARWKIILA
ncbi:hypothetical protein DOTSEDRAFT_57289 [Dothistroma septosporum NZE10]|uniref:Major facilitator superfamily (MFS) profile domain-containing protein n=1 Tax=Dothistroma septosporum (strain NZE10 / CBS 128990) TaxID=675120 RepID=M2Y106_DOTSN|nr:hypothetical protein DOTSEDRAFT_57289 [Dothistroma septosporum NZE10]